MKLTRNAKAWYLTTFFIDSAFVLPIWVIFNTQFLGLNNTQAFLLGVVPHGLSALFEVPTGSWADKFGRAKVLRLGTLLLLISVASYVFFRNFYVLLLFQMLGAVGIAMQSGCPEAMVHDSLPGKNKEQAYARIHGNNYAILFTSRVITVVIGSLLYTVNPKVPFIAFSSALFIGVLTSFLFKDVRLETPTEKSSLDHIKETFGLMINAKFIVTVLSLIVLFRFSAEVLFAFFQPYFVSLGIAVGSFGIFYAIISIYSGLGSLWIGRLIGRHSVFTLLLSMMAGLITTLAGMLLRLPWLTYLVIIPSALIFGFGMTIMNTSVQKMISSRHQATALSIASFANSATFFLAVISLGVTLDRVSVTAANVIFLIVTVVFTMPFVANVRRTLKSKVI